ncbi:AraC family transcriptional regulator [Orrella daihaiensis]|uniref:AraC family transcriptional regulator n=1 Tax=Orrella daihaiensis TaxID=2782176 RepID=A0ABY4AIZ4_9BURK|nr:AraC family transcriptional regulator [Orrella daihaiensis]UOD50048.1 AraC family transcriptional regulator [Orrella daihaiensis]
MERIDRLTAIFERFAPQVQVQFADRLFGSSNFPADQPIGHIHWLKSGQVILHSHGTDSMSVDQQSVIFVPGPTAHTIHSTEGAELVCAQFEFGQRFRNPLTLLEPAIIVLPVAEIPELAAVHNLLMDEAFSDRCGKSLAANQLLQYFLLVLFRHLIKTNTVPVGPLKALGDEKILRAVTSMHRDPGNAWTLEHLADIATMSRATFARRFRDLMGKTPLDYLTDWRIAVAQSLLAQGKPTKSVAHEVGYSSTAVLTRIFTQRVGNAPRQWLALNQTPVTNQTATIHRTLTQTNL